MDAKRVKIKYTPREPFRSFHKRKQRWSVLVCHRRAGKTVATLNDLIRGAFNECKPEGRYAFIFPQRNQAKDTAWRYLRRYAEPLLAKPPNESELRVDLVNGSMIRLYGADNPDAEELVFAFGSPDERCPTSTVCQHRPDHLMPYRYVVPT